MVIKVPWYPGWGRGRRWLGPWPGNGPFRYLPPWQRPGWLYGRGACWRIFGIPGGWFWWRYWVYNALRYPLPYQMVWPYSW